MSKTILLNDRKVTLQEQFDQSIEAIGHPKEEAIMVIVFVPYIQPFSDGNKRTGRMLANAILLAHDFYPLSYRSVDETTFKESPILFYETHSILQFKKILLTQYHFALDTYFK